MKTAPRYHISSWLFFVRSEPCWSLSALCLHVCSGATAAARLSRRRGPGLRFRRVANTCDRYRMLVVGCRRLGRKSRWYRCGDTMITQELDGQQVVFPVEPGWWISIRHCTTRGLPCQGSAVILIGTGALRLLAVECAIARRGVDDSSDAFSNATGHAAWREPDACCADHPGEEVVSGIDGEATPQEAGAIECNFAQGRPMETIRSDLLASPEVLTA